MGCVASRLEEEEVVAICRERKRQLKLAVERRYALADAHYRYCQSLYGVSAAIRLFVARHSNPPSPFMIILPPPIIPQPPPQLSAAAAGLPPPQQENVVVSNPLFLQQTPSEPTKATTAAATTTVHHCESCQSSTASEDSDSSEEEEEKLQKEPSSSNEYFYMEMMPPHQSTMMPSPQREFGGWDFFNPFFTSVRPEIILYNDGYNGNTRILSNEEINLKAVRELEGIPELEEDEEEEDTRGKDSIEIAAQRGNVEKPQQQKNEDEEKGRGLVVEHDESVNQKGGGGELLQKGLAVIDTPVGGGRELLEALGDIEDHFIRAYDSGKDLSRMLEVNRVQLQSNLEEIKENSRKKIQAITLRSSSTKSSSCKSLVASSSSKSLITWSTEFKNDLFDDYGGMDSGSHSLTLGRIYAWEKKLYEEVKAGDNIRKIYERKCSQLRHKDVRGPEGVAVDKTRAAVKDLYSRILVAIRSAETISQRIEKLRDEELEPQIMELLQGMMKCWQIMLESHEIQNKIVKTFTCPTYGKFCNESHRLSTLQLEVELQNWRTCFKEYIAALKLYVEALHGWISKFIVPEEVEIHSRSRNRSASLRPGDHRVNGPPLLIICCDWLSAMNNLPDKAVSTAIRSCKRDVKALWVQQGKEQQQKRKVDSLSKELETKTLAFQKAENQIYEFRLTEKAESEMEVDSTDHKTEQLKEKKYLLDNFRRKVELEKEIHQNCMQETQRITLNGFQAGFGRVFESMTEFSKTALKMCNDLISSDIYGEKFQNDSSYSHGSQLENG